MFKICKPDSRVNKKIVCVCVGGGLTELWRHVTFGNSYQLWAGSKFFCNWTWLLHPHLQVSQNVQYMNWSSIHHIEHAKENLLRPVYLMSNCTELVSISCLWKELERESLEFHNFNPQWFHRMWSTMFHSHQPGRLHTNRPGTCEWGCG